MDYLLLYLLITAQCPYLVFVLMFFVDVAGHYDFSAPPRLKKLRHKNPLRRAGRAEE